MDEQRLYNLQDAGRMLGGISRGTFYNMAKRGEVTLVKIGRRTMVSAGEIERLIVDGEELAHAAIQTTPRNS